jgi:hypothetical protein
MVEVGNLTTALVDERQHRLEAESQDEKSYGRPILGTAPLRRP